MKLNNKGLTLVELLVSIALVSIVMAFMFKLLSDANDISNSDSFAAKNQINRNEIIKTIQKDIVNYKLDSISASNDNKTITFIYDNQNEQKLIINTNGNYITYETMEKNASGDLENVTKKWTMNDCEIGDVLFNDDNGIVNINIEIYTNNEKNDGTNGNNLEDDIMIDFIYDKKE